MVKSHYEDYGGVMSRQTFFSLLNDATTNYQGLVVLPCCISSSLQDYMMLTCAEKIPENYKLLEGGVEMKPRTLPVFRKRQRE